MKNRVFKSIFGLGLLLFSFGLNAQNEPQAVELEQTPPDMKAMSTGIVGPGEPDEVPVDMYQGVLLGAATLMIAGYAIRKRKLA